MAWRLTWVQLGKRQAADFAQLDQAEDARDILAWDTNCSGLKVTQLPKGETADLSGPRQLDDDVQGVRVVTPYNDPRWQSKRRNGQQGRHGRAKEG